MDDIGRSMRKLRAIFFTHVECIIYDTLKFKGLIKKTQLHALTENKRLTFERLPPLDLN